MSPKPWWYISFASESGFLGAVQVQAETQERAIIQSHKLRINPGGEAMVCGPLPGEIVRAGGLPVNSLITREQIEAVDKLFEEADHEGSV